MSILDNNNVPNTPAPAKIAADQLIMMAVQSYQQMVHSFNRGSNIFWNNNNGASPSEISAELGTNAKEVFELHGKLGQLLASVKPEAIAEGLSVVGNFTINADGTVTING
jgi:hypothetical protein